MTPCQFLFGSRANGHLAGFCVGAGASRGKVRGSGAAIAGGAGIRSLPAATGTGKVG
jgi:hypothetical protein